MLRIKKRELKWHGEPLDYIIVLTPMKERGRKEDEVQIALATAKFQKYVWKLMKRS